MAGTDDPPPLQSDITQSEKHPFTPENVSHEKYSVPSLDTFNTLTAIPDTNDSLSPSGQRANATRFNDDLELLRIEQAVSAEEDSHSKRVHHAEPEDAFNQPMPSDPAHNEDRRDNDAALVKLWLFLRKFPRFFRYLVYLIPGAALLLVPVLLGALAFRKSNRAVGGKGGVYIMWFGIWLEIVWGSFWVSKMITSLLPITFKTASKLLGSTTPNKWRDIGSQLEFSTALFLWMLAVLVSFMPTINNHRVPVPSKEKDDANQDWIGIVNKVIIALFTMATLNFVEKILIQWIATSFHQRTYATRIDNNKSDIQQLVQLFEHARTHNEEPDYFWQRGGSTAASGTQTPMQTLQDNARQAWNKVGYVAGRVGNDLIGRKVDKNHPRKVVYELLRTTASAHTLARLIYRSTAKPGRDLVLLEDLQTVFTAEEEAEAAFAMFDKDMNGDISLEEMEAVCNEIHLEKKAIAASLKDLDSVIQKLDKVFLFIIFVISVVVFISILSGSAAAALGSAGTVVLGLSWLLQATAQEFLQSIIFVFVKHPFDVGDRVKVYGSTGDLMMGDDYYVTEISLLYTEFKKMQGHIVQAPNSILNTLFILNQRRSNGLADPIQLRIRFGTPSNVIEELKARMLNFCLANKRDYQPRIISELSILEDVRSCTISIVFFHKSNFQNELLRLNRHNKFCIELMSQMVELGIQSPLRVEPGGSRDHPMYWTSMPPPPSYAKDQPPDTHEGPPVSRSLSTSTTKAEMIDQADRRPADASLHDFQDVFENRKEHLHAHRLASIREKGNGVKAEKEASPRASSSAMERVSSATESRARIFGGRMRSKSKASKSVEMV
ncbi:Mechanosensitive ion channel-domain-containing protein [Mariannaea sp. PMI_226]|nr:Mechanosensitive ion channel-domain-containing protein [Mariannaea sp. PMI_226]